MYRLTLVKRSAITKSKPLIPCTQHARWMAQRPADLEHEEYKPWANENSTCGTTRETVDRRVASDNCVDAEKELNEDREESESRGEPGVLEYSAANSRMSQQTNGEDGMWRQSDVDRNPSRYEQQPKRPPPREGLFKPAKKNVYRNLT
ncbi:hypothetical protein O0I10_012624 [Lichtheimia ornata]|uniref:Uncharacterized protein n=1 Tax=Lichtheimia ornata TaxID=688661 RepID=A0AAD7XSX5_9FUNG|nr:uncharacterized protein O0I10_012624 [Lichtheimia ornata]KAJ8651803.1 hypothetical protein O0I10_012624 [Lichtheimia ornata]